MEIAALMLLGAGLLGLAVGRWRFLVVPVVLTGAMIVVVLLSDTSNDWHGDEAGFYISIILVFGFALLASTAVGVGLRRATRWLRRGGRGRSGVAASWIVPLCVLGLAFLVLTAILYSPSFVLLPISVIGGLVCVVGLLGRDMARARPRDE